jgi:hypothetical protein
LRGDTRLGVTVQGEGVDVVRIELGEHPDHIIFLERLARVYVEPHERHFDFIPDVDATVACLDAARPGDALVVLGIAVGGDRPRYDLHVNLFDQPLEPVDCVIDIRKRFFHFAVHNQVLMI